jgi:4-hydroxy-tetrahydrodipicolinate synthase
MHRKLLREEAIEDRLMNLTAFRGSFTALVTPFLNGKLDEKAFRDLVEWQIAQGTHGLVPVGTTGESPTLSHDEHNKVIEWCIDQNKGRLPIIAGAGSNNTAEAISLSLHAQKAGADALLHVAPYYNKPTQEGLYAHFKAIADAVSIPIIIYNIPPRSVVDISVATMARMAEHKNLVGVKDATGNIVRISQQREACGHDFIQFIGNDDMAVASAAAGAHGCISVGSNVAPKQYADLQNALIKGDFASALKMQDKLMPLNEALFIESNPSPAKYALSLLGRMREDVRLPMLPIAQSTKEKMQAAMKIAGLL